MRKLLTATFWAAIGGAIPLSIPASATDLTFTMQGTVTSFIDVDNVYGFGAGANLDAFAHSVRDKDVDDEQPLVAESSSSKPGAGRALRL